MPTYIALGKFTDKGIVTIKEMTGRLKKAKEIIESTGGKTINIYFTMGQYDWVTITEFPNNEAAMKALLAFGGGGTAKTETLVAFPAEKTVKIIEEL
jgi:uncharacterized protein with GYD domain